MILRINDDDDNNNDVALGWVRSMNLLVYTAGMQKNKRVGPACFLATKRVSEDTAYLKINRLASIPS